MVMAGDNRSLVPVSLARRESHADWPRIATGCTPWPIGSQLSAAGHGPESRQRLVSKL